MALVDKLPYETDLIVAAGTTFVFVLRWLPGGEPVDLTEWDAWMPLGRSLDAPVAELTAENGEIVLGSDGLITITIGPERTAEFATLDIPTNKGTGVLYYNLTLQDTLGKVERFLRGRMYIEHDVQRYVPDDDLES